MRRGFKSWCEKQALQWRTELGLLPYQHLPARKLADLLKIDVISPQEVPGLPQKDLKQLLYYDHTGWSATSISVDGCSIIINNPQHSRARQESDIMHELAHMICKHKPIKLVSLPGIPFPFREYRKEDEKEAEWLGACLQIPRDGLLHVIRKGMAQNEQIAKHFEASLEMVQFRRNVTGVDKQLQRGWWRRRR